MKTSYCIGEPNSTQFLILRAYVTYMTVAWHCIWYNSIITIIVQLQTLLNQTWKSLCKYILTDKKYSGTYLHLYTLKKTSLQIKNFFGKLHFSWFQTYEDFNQKKSSKEMSARVCMFWYVFECGSFLVGWGFIFVLVYLSKFLNPK